MTRREKWQIRGEENGWRMPPAPAWYWRLPIIRHVWVMWEGYKVYRWYAYGPGALGVPTGYDEWALHGMFWNFWPKNKV